MALSPIIVLQVLTGLGFFGHSLPQLMNQKKHDFPTKAVLTTMFGAAILLIIGVYVRLMSVVLLLITLLSLYERVRHHESFVGGWENTYLYAVCALVILIGGTGWFGW